MHAQTADTSGAVAAPEALSAEKLSRYMPLVRHVVARFLARLPANVLRDDLVAAGTYGLLDALRKSDDTEGPAFEWYARVRIRGAILDELRSQDWLSRSARKRAQTEHGEGVASIRAILAFDDLSEASRNRLTDESAQSALEGLEQRDVRKSVEVALQGLLERERLIVNMHYFEGVQFNEIAALLRVSEPRVSQLHKRAMLKLRGALGEAA